MFTPTGYTKEKYWDLMEQSIGAYSVDYLTELVCTNEANGISEHGFFRITAVMGLLIAHGRRPDLMPLWLRAMDLSCRTVWEADIHAERTKNCGIDFAVKELIFVLLEIRGKNLVPAERYAAWLDGIRRVNPQKNYRCVASSPTERLGNWGIYNAAGEYLREYIGVLSSADGYLDVQIPSQLLSVDENGMYIDPNAPMLYDLASRAQFAVLLHFGYNGAFRAPLDEALRKAGLLTLQLQSANGEIPFGGRSNQFLFNEAYLAACCEFEATRYAGAGNLPLAGAFKRAAHLALGVILRWMSGNPVKHIKNAFPIDSAFGLENYAYFDKYMVTLGSFLYLAVLFADDTIAEAEAPCETGGFLAQTSPIFHKVAAVCGGYSIEMDTRADFHYDATGLGRFQRCGAPSELALSVPFPKTATYSLEDRPFAAHYADTAEQPSNPSLLAIAPAIRLADGSTQLLCTFSDDLTSTVHLHTATEECVVFSVTWRSPAFRGFTEITEQYRLSADGLTVSATGDWPADAELLYTVPLLQTNGRDKTFCTLHSAVAEAEYLGWKYTVRGNGAVCADSGMTYANRNGIYRRLDWTLSQGASLQFCLERL